MITKVLKADSPGAIDEAARLLREGCVVAFPTDTVYGLGANIFIREAIDRVFAAKGREAAKALPVLLADAADLPLVAASLSPDVRKLVDAFWPGALTVVVPKAAQVPGVVTGDSPTIAVRVPNHPVARELIRRCGVPVAGTSANRAGHRSCRTATEVRADLDGIIEAILDGGRSPGGVESTVIDLAHEEPRVLRRGAIEVKELERALGRKVEL